MPELMEISGLGSQKDAIWKGLLALLVVLGGISAAAWWRHRDEGFEGLGIIRPCRPKDRTPSKRLAQQKWCLWDSKGKRILGRHPTRSSALRQERAIQARKHG